MSIQKRAPGRYEVSVDDGFDEKTGKRRRKWMSVPGTKKEAEKAERELLSQRDRGIALVPTGVLFGEYLERWLTEYAESNVAPSTFCRYQIVVRKHLVPHLGHLRLDQIQPIHVQTIHRVCRAEGLAQSTVRQHHRVLSKALKLAVQWRLIQSNPAASISAPRVPRHEMHVLDGAETKALLQFALGDPMYPFAYLAIQTGSRNGELCGLRWSDIDWSGGRLSIRRTAQRPPGQGLQMRPTKTHRSSRSVSLSPDSLAFLKELLPETEPASEQPAGPNLGYVLPQPTGAPYEPGQVTKGFRRLKKKAGLPDGFRFHDLRHTAATLLMSAGVHPKVVSERMGHATVSITLDTYSHVLPSLQDEAALAMDDILRADGTDGTDAEDR